MSILIERSGASSNIPSSGLQRFGVLCHCNLDAPLMTLWIEDNPSRRFFDCGLYKVCSIDNLDASLITVDFFFFNFFCSLFIYFMFSGFKEKKMWFFQWFDPPINDHVKRIMVWAAKEGGLVQTEGKWHEDQDELSE